MFVKIVSLVLKQLKDIVSPVMTQIVRIVINPKTIALVVCLDIVQMEVDVRSVKFNIVQSVLFQQPLVLNAKEAMLYLPRDVHLALLHLNDFCGKKTFCFKFKKKIYMTYILKS
jgi:hypothetical protein